MISLMIYHIWREYFTFYKVGKKSFLKQVDSTSLQYVCETLELAFKLFFNKQGGYPRFKSFKTYSDSYT